MRTSTMLIAALLALPACAESVESDDVLTDGMYAELRAEASEDGTRITATLRVGGATSNTYVMLTGADSLTATAAGETEEMTAQNNGGNVFRYTADLDATAEDTVVVFRFDRSIDDGAPNSRCTLPRAMTIEAPVDGEVFRRADQDVEITWDTSGSNRPIDLTVEGECFDDVSVSLEDDPGSYTIQAGTLTSVGDPPSACEATVRLSRRNNGTLDPGFGEGGSVVCSQVRTTTFRSDP
jgi:major membrane immunogen (membrane-anchored lipoprotein)